jgi:large subunit ribosomal protein L19e
MKLDKVKKLAAKVFKVGEKRVWIDPAQESKAKEAMTKDDVRQLIAEGVIKKRKPMSLSRARANALMNKKRKGRKKGRGKRKGTPNARTNKKKLWAAKVRAQRKVLREIRKSNPKAFEKVSYADVYRKIKGGYFRGKKYVEAYVKEGE